MAGLDPAIHVFVSEEKARRGSPGQARWWRGHSSLLLLAM